MFRACQYITNDMLPIYMLPIANFDAYTMPIRKKTIFDECLYAIRTFVRTKVPSFV